MTYIDKFVSLGAAFVAMAFLSSCGGAKAGMPTPAGSWRSVPGYGEGTGSSGQTSAARLLYANPLPGGGPYAQSVQSNGTLASAAVGSANNVNPRTMAIDPSGSFVFQTAEGYNGGTHGGVFVYPINRSNGSLGQASSSYLTGQAVYSDVVDNQGKFLYVQAAQGVYGFSIQSGTGALTQITGSPFAASGPSSPGYSQPASLMAVDQTNHFLYVSTMSGIAGFTIDQTTGQLTPIAGSPFGANVKGPWTIVVTPNNGFLYELESQNSATLNGYSIDHKTGALTSLQGSPFSAGTCGSVVAPGTVGIPGPDNMTVATAGKFMYDNCGIYSFDPTSGALAQVSSSGPGDWPVIDPSGNFLWAISSDQQSCFHCDIGVTTYQVDSNTGGLTPVLNSFLLLTNSAVGSVNSLAITK